MKTLNLFLFLIFSINTFSQIVPINNAEKVARNLFCERYNLTSEIKKTNVIIEDYITYTSNNNPCLYIFNIKGNNGFVIISADKRVYPILGYGLTRNFDTSNIAPATKYLLQNYIDLIDSVRLLKTLSDENTQLAWNFYKSENFYPQSQMLSVGPLLTTSWNQGCFFNQFCPPDTAGPCNRCVTGCVATAMAQIMKYHQYPINGIGSKSYNCGSYGILSADFSNANYNYSSMPLVQNWNPLWGLGVSKLVYHCGVSLNMNYGPTGSGANTSRIRSSLIDYFNYSPVKSYPPKNAVSNSVWESWLKSDIDSGWPIGYRGGVSPASHAWVIDGYQGSQNNHFHMNFGWGGPSDGYYYINNILCFNSNQGAILNMRPKLLSYNGGCISLSNFLPEDTIACYELSTFDPSLWGYFAGHNSEGIKGYAERFPSISNTYITGARIYTGKAKSSSTNSNILLRLWNLHENNVDTIIYSQQVPINSFNENQFDTVHFNYPVTVNNYYYLGFELDYSNPLDTFASYCYWDIYGGYGVSRYLSSNNNWMKFTDSRMAIKIEPLICDSVSLLPTANYQNSKNTIAQFDSIKFNDLSTKYISNWQWEFEGGNPSFFIGSSPPRIKYDSIGTFDVKLVVTSQFGTDTLVQENFITVESRPLSNDTAVSLLEDSNYVILRHNFPFQPANISDTLEFIKFYNLPVRGDIFLNNLPLSISDSINVNNLNTGMLVYIPDTNFSGKDSASFQVRNNEYWSLHYKLSFNVENINDTPFIASSYQQYISQDKGLRVDTSMLVIFDPDDNIFSINLLQGLDYSIVGLDSIVPSPSFTGNLEVLLTVSDTSNATSPVHKLNVNVASNSSVEDKYSLYRISIFPNPLFSKNNLTVRIPDNTKQLIDCDITITIADVYGKVVKEIILNNEEINNSNKTFNISLSGIAQGLYIVNIKNLKISSTTKLLIIEK